MKDFSNYLFRASQCHYLVMGTIGLTEVQEIRYQELLERSNGIGKALTPNMEIELKELGEKRVSKELPKTMQKELRKIHRAEKYNRNFVWTNKYVQKGIQQEEEGISVLQQFLRLTNADIHLFKNKTRFNDNHFSGEPDTFDHLDPKKRKKGFDTKISWDLTTHPFEDDDIKDIYETQNQVYMHLTGLDEWETMHCLVNATEAMVFNEKNKHFYALNSPDMGDRYYDEYINKCIEIEKMMIFDRARFEQLYPYYNWEISRDEWYGEGYDIPLEDRVMIKKSTYDKEQIDFLKERVLLAREYLKNLK